jgi:hypothetical protein
MQTSNNFKALDPNHKQGGELKQQLHKRRTKQCNKKIKREEDITKIYATIYFPEFKFVRGVFVEKGNREAETFLKREAR